MSVFHPGRSRRVPATSTDTRFRRSAVQSSDPLSHELRTSLDIYQANRPMPNLLMR